MRRKGKTKAPDIDILARHYLSRGLSKHPDVVQHVANVDDLEQMPMWSLLTLAKKYPSLNARRAASPCS
jgi:hypothetical protein